MLRAAGYAAGASAASGLAFAAYMHTTFGPDALPRLAQSYRVSVPAMFAYKAVEFFHDKLPRRLGREVDERRLKEEYEALHRVHAHRLFEAFSSLRGFYLKTGQLIASNIADASPEYWQEVFKPFLDQVPHRPFSVVREVLERDFGRPLGEVFSAFDETPIAAASIGQVHRATLAGTGERVVVKVMYQETEGLFRGDVATAKHFLQVAMPEHVPALREIEKQFANEFDYAREAAQLEQVRKNLEASGDFPDVVVPRPRLDLCTKSVLVMEEVPNAVTLGDALRRDMTAFAAEKGVSLDALMSEEKALNDAAYARGELRCGPTAAEMDAYIAARSWRNFLLVPLGFAPQHVPLNHGKLVDELLRVHGHEIFIDGFFNGDPHPGNVLVSNPSKRLALVDYGQVKVLDLEKRRALARIVAALAECGDTLSPPAEKRKKVADAMHAAGFRTRSGDVDVAYKLARVYFDRDDRIATGGVYVQTYIEALGEADPVTVVADDFVMAARAGLLLRGLGHQLNQHRGLAKAWGPFAERVLAEERREKEGMTAAAKSS